MIIPALPIAACFALGAALGPTDAVAVGSLSGKIQIPPKAMHILEGEGLINDASGVTAFQFALAALLTGSFSIAEAGISLVVSSIGGALIGAALVMIKRQVVLILEKASARDVTGYLLLELLLPFLAYMVAELFHVSGIIAAVVAESDESESSNDQGIELLKDVIMQLEKINNEDPQVEMNVVIENYQDRVKELYTEQLPTEQRQEVQELRALMVSIERDGLEESFRQKEIGIEGIRDKDRIGLIGTNGTGKTSLLNILAGIDSGDGDIHAIQQPNDYQIGYLSQDQTFDLDLTVVEAVFQGDTPIIKAVKNYELALLALAENGSSEAAQKKYAQAEERMNKEDAWTADTDAKIILQKLGIETLHKKIGELSGGQKKRVSLAQVLIESPDLLLLDEPTNHLDYEAIRWLESFLNSYRGAILMVTHDRYFLDRVTNRIFELSFGKLHEYKGNYEAYLLAKAERERVEVDQEEKRKQLYKQELEWMRAGVQARGTKQQARQERFHDLKENLNQVNHKGQLEIDVGAQRLGKKVLEIQDGCYQIEDNVILHEFNLLIQAKDRIGITGKNGAGKSTLLNILAGRIPLKSGVYLIGETVHLAYYTQQNEAMDPNKRMIAYLQDAAEQVQRNDGTTISVAELLERFLFPRFMHGTIIGKLSGGEKRRLYLLKLLITQPNVLLLDEPTNDLDIDTLTILEDYIQSFKGAVIAVSHDRYFLDKTMEKLLIFQGSGQIDRYFGSMSEYVTTIKDQSKKIAKIENKSLKKAIDKKEKNKLTYMEQKEWETIEAEIEVLEETAVKLTEEMNHQGDDFTTLQQLQNELTIAEKELEDKMERWEYLSEFVNN
ncbi:hypothetical protein HW555_014437 [Spodoptera exigua]|uniref:ABC transporter domain-containing protein n=1 Tax=Spodoptera exigua TaxID=7107 RepID=A0A835L1G9_SPOEX|nr:hypothetical protein HW555_014437 [Spodoptera exigua]